MSWAFDSRLLHPLLARRQSPARFDPVGAVSEEAVEVLLEAARWAPSAGNSQPWSFIVGHRGDWVHQRLVARLAGSSMAWAPEAGLLIANLSHRLVEGTDFEYSEFSLYDLGQAVAHMTIQAEALGLSSRQFRAFDRDAIAADFAVPDHWQVMSMTAVGRPRPEPGSGHVRDRREPSDLLWPSGRT